MQLFKGEREVITMAKRKSKSTMGSEAPVTDEVREFLSANGRRGGHVTARYIELGKQAAEKSGEDVKSEVFEELHGRGNTSIRRGEGSPASR